MEPGRQGDLNGEAWAFRWEAIPGGALMAVVEEPEHPDTNKMRLLRQHAWDYGILHGPTALGVRWPDGETEWLREDPEM